MNNPKYLHSLKMLFGFTFLAFAGCQQGEPKKSPPTPVHVTVLSAETISSQIQLAATVREQQRIGLSFKVPGTVASLLQVPGLDGKPRDVQEGDLVTLAKDRSLAQLDDSDYKRQLRRAQEQAGKAADKERATLASTNVTRLTFDRIKALRSNDSVPQQTYDDAMARKESAEAELDAARREVETASVMLQQAEDDLRNCQLFSPLTEAVVSRRTIESGERVQSGQPVFEVMDLSRVRVAFGVSDVQLRHFTIGQELTIAADAFPGSRFTGHITKIGPAADLKTRTFEVELTINQPKGLKPGMVVTILTRHQETMFLLPMTAVHRSNKDGGCFVFVVMEENGQHVARQRDVKFDGVYDNRLRILVGPDSPVKAGDTVVVAGSFRLTEGQPVRVLDAKGAALRVGN